MTEEIKNQELIQFKKNKSILANSISEDIISLITEIKEGLDDVQQDGWSYNYSEGNFSIEQRTRNPVIDEVLNSEFWFKDIVETLPSKIINMVSDKVVDHCFNKNENLRPLLVDLTSDDIFPKELRNSIQDKIDYIENKEILKTKTFNDVCQSKISLTMFRYDKDLENNIKQNEILKDILNKEIRNSGVYVNLANSEGFWYENGDKSIEPGFTIYGKSEDVSKILPKVLKVMENLEAYGLSNEHKQSGIYHKENDVAKILELNDQGKYVEAITLPYQISLNSNELNFQNQFLEACDKNDETKTIGGTTLEGNLSLSLSDEKQYKAVINICEKLGFQHSGNEAISINKINKERAKAFKLDLADIPF